MSLVHFIACRGSNSLQAFAGGYLFACCKSGSAQCVFRITHYFETSIPEQQSVDISDKNGYISVYPLRHNLLFWQGINIYLLRIFQGLPEGASDIDDSEPPLATCEYEITNKTLSTATVKTKIMCLDMKLLIVKLIKKTYEEK